MSTWDELAEDAQVIFDVLTLKEMDVNSRTCLSLWEASFNPFQWRDAHLALNQLGPYKISCVFRRDIIRVRFIDHMGQFLQFELVVSCHILKKFVPKFDAIFEAASNPSIHEESVCLPTSYASWFLHSRVDLLSQRLLNLTMLCLTQSPLTTDSYMRRFRECLTLLVSVQVEGCFEAGDIVMGLLATVLRPDRVAPPCLRHLPLGRKMLLSDRSIQQLCTVQLSLRPKMYNISDVTDYNLKVMSSTRTLVNLGMSTCISIDVGVANLELHYADVTTLHLWYVESLTDTELGGFNSLIALQHVSLRSCPLLTSVGLLCLRRDKTGKETRISRLEIINCAGMNNASLSVLAHWRHLRRLVLLQSMEYTDAGIWALLKGGKSGLSYLAISNCFGLSHHTLSMIAHRKFAMRWMRDLILDRSLVTRDGMLSAFLQLGKLATFRSVGNNNEYKKEMREVKTEYARAHFDGDFHIPNDDEEDYEDEDGNDCLRLGWFTHHGVWRPPHHGVWRPIL